MILLIRSGPHVGEHFQWEKFAPPKRLELQSSRPGLGHKHLSRPSVGVAIYNRSPDSSNLPPRHIKYRYVRFEAQSDPPIFNAVSE